MNTAPHEQSTAVYPCGPDTWWELYADRLAVNTNRMSGARFTIGLQDLDGIDFKESGLKPGCAQLIPVDALLHECEDETILIFPLDTRYKEQRRAFLQTFSVVAPHVVVQAVDVSPDKELKWRIADAQVKASIAARDANKAERLALAQEQRDRAVAADIQQSFFRPDGTLAPEPVATIGSVHGLHFRLYPDAIVQVSWAEDRTFRNETVYYTTQISELQWAGSLKGHGFIRLEPAGPLVHLDISNDPTAARLSPHEMDTALRRISELYPALRVRRIAVLADVLGNVIFGSTDKKVRTALGFIPSFTAERHLTGASSHAIALDPGQQKLCVIDIHTWACRIYRPSDLLSVEVYEDSRMQVSHRRDGRGGRRLATAGFLVGDIVSISAGLAANKASKPKEELLELTLRIALDDPKLPICDVRLSLGSTKLSGGGHHSLSAEARTWASLIGALIRSAESRPTPSQAAVEPVPSIAAELAQLANLREAGHITEAELVDLKSRLLGR